MKKLQKKLVFCVYVGRKAIKLSAKDLLSLKKLKKRKTPPIPGFEQEEIRTSFPEDDMDCNQKIDI